MMSDGVLMGLGQDDDRNEEKMAEFLKSCQAVNPQELANAILNHAMAACHYEAEDDMTVLVCGTANRSCNMRHVFWAMCRKCVECSVGGGLKWRGLTEYVILKIQSIRTL